MDVLSYPCFSYIILMLDYIISVSERNPQGPLKYHSGLRGVDINGMGPIWLQGICNPYSDVTMSAIASEITGVSIGYLTICSGTDQTKHQSSASLAFIRGIHRSPMTSPHKGPVKRKMFLSDDVTWRSRWHGPTVTSHWLWLCGCVIHAVSLWGHEHAITLKRNIVILTMFEVVIKVQPVTA